MTFPAWFEIHDDPEIVASPTALRIYAKLVRRPTIFFEPQDVKAWALAEELNIERSTVQHALTLLISKGYVIQHGTGLNNVKRLTVAMVRERAS
jgi:DNA-binding MarR family transcriptional regulator